MAPPFAEELNKSRRMLALCGEASARRGVPLLLPDLHGTADSTGDFSDARWEVWLADLVAAIELMAAHGVERTALLGLRLGALLAVELSPVCRVPVESLLLWQPVLSGRQYLTQFLRLGVAAAMAAGATETVAAIRERLRRDGTVEIGGYALARELVAAIEERDLCALDPPCAPVRWFDVSTDPSRPLAASARQIIDRWRAAGSAVDVVQVSGDAFWATQEIAVVPALVEVTAAAVVPRGAMP